MATPLPGLGLLVQPNSIQHNLVRLRETGISEDSAIFQMTVPEALAELPFTYEEFETLRSSLAHRHAPQVQSVAALRAEYSTKTVPLNIPLMDNTLYGGIPPGVVTEVSGGAGSGKTQLCFSLCVTALMKNTNATCIYIDTEGSFSASRLNEIVQDRGGSTELLNRVIVYRLSSCKELSDCLGELEVCILERGVSLVILDSLAAVVRSDVESIATQSRQSVVSGIATTLKDLASAFSIPVVVTNQLASSRDHPTSGSNDGTQSADIGTPMLGIVWGHAANVRLMVRPTATGREILLTKCPFAPSRSAPFTIMKCGIVTPA